MPSTIKWSYLTNASEFHVFFISSFVIAEDGILRERYFVSPPVFRTFPAHLSNSAKHKQAWTFSTFGIHLIWVLPTFRDNIFYIYIHWNLKYYTVFRSTTLYLEALHYIWKDCTVLGNITLHLEILCIYIHCIWKHVLDLKAQHCTCKH